MIKGFAEAVKRMKRAIEMGVNCNDMTRGEMGDEICFVFDTLAKENGEPEIDWEAPYAEDA